MLRRLMSKLQKPVPITVQQKADFQEKVQTSVVLFDQSSSGLLTFNEVPIYSTVSELIRAPARRCWRCYGSLHGVRSCQRWLNRALLHRERSRLFHQQNQLAMPHLRFIQKLITCSWSWRYTMSQS